MSEREKIDSGLIVTAPLDEDSSLFWWRVEDGVIVSRGNDHSPPHHSPLQGHEGDAPFRLMALLPASDTVLRSRIWPDMPVRQAETAARIDGIAQSIDSHPFVAVQGSSIAGQTHVLTATIARDTLSRRLGELSLRGLDPDIVLPVGCLLDDANPGDNSDDDTPREAVFGDLGVIRQGPLVLPISDPLKDHLLPGVQPETLDQDARDVRLIHALAAPQINLRQGEFARSEPAFQLDAQQKRTLIRLTVCLLLLSLAIPLLLIAKLHWDANRIEENALTEARTVVPEAQTLAQAEMQIDQRLASRGIGNAAPSASIAALLSNMQPVDGLFLRELNYRPDGLVSAIVAAPRAEDINQMLISLQQNGYVVTAAPRSDTTGAAIADLTMRAP